MDAQDLTTLELDICLADRAARDTHAELLEMVDRLERKRELLRAQKIRVAELVETLATAKAQT